MSGEVAMKFVSDARQLLTDIEKEIKAQERLEQKTGDVAKAVAARRKEQATMAREALKIEKEMSTPIEKYKQRLQELDKLRKAGVLTEETHRRAVVAAWKESGMAAVQAEKALKKEQVERAKLIEVEKRQQESAARRARYEETLGRRRKEILREIETPQERYNAKLRELNRLLRTGNLSQNQYRAAVRKAQDALDDQSVASKKAIDLGGVESLAARWLSVGGVIAAATSAIRDYEAAVEEAA